MGFRNGNVHIGTTLRWPQNKSGQDAYATFLSGTVSGDPEDMEDHYFVATRILAYQLLHEPSTRTNRSMPFIVLVTDDIPEIKRERLRLDGATVIPMPYLRPANDWIHGEIPEWDDVMTKLRAWDLTQYSRILFLDGDTILSRRLDELFDDPACQMRQVETNGSWLLDEGTQPQEYVLASIPETNPVHSFPPTIENGGFKDPDYFNAGFFLFSPSKAVLDHYKAVMELENRYDPRYPEQNLLNYAHRRNGTMPWQEMNNSWNIRFPQLEDVIDGDIASVHDKWWHAHMDPRLDDVYQSIRWSMEGFYEGISGIAE